MVIDIITLFPEMFGACSVSRSSLKRQRTEGRLCGGPFGESIVKRARDEDIVNINLHNLRDWAIDERGTVDDRPYGGGSGMLLRPEPVFEAVSQLRESKINPRTGESPPRRPAEEVWTGNQESKEPANHSISSHQSSIILLDAGGKLYNQQKAVELSRMDNLILICGHYEGVDYRVHKHLADEVLSIGNYILTGGEIPAMVLVDSIVRLLPGVLDRKTTKNESFSLEPRTIPRTVPKALVRNLDLERPLVEWPQYTRPETYRGHTVPEILLSGHHAEIEKWRKKRAIERTKQNRPDLLKTGNSS